MARRERVFLDHGVYHVYCRVTRGESIFDQHEDAMAFVDAAKKIKEIDGLRVLAWCLMSNHYHMVVRTDTTPLWRSMLRFQPQVTRHHNRRRRVFGPLWQSRYRARLVHDESYYRQVIAYVHLNPVVAGLVPDPADWRWSGHAALIGNTSPILVDPTLSLVGFGETLAEARCMYQKSVRGVAEMRWSREGVRDLPWWKRARNDRQLIADDEIPDEAVNWRGQAVLRNDPPPPLQLLLQLCAKASGCAISEILSTTQRRNAVTARDAFARVAVDTFNYRVVDVATLLRKHPNSLSRWRTRPSTAESEDIQRLMAAAFVNSENDEQKMLGC